LTSLLHEPTKVKQDLRPWTLNNSFLNAGDMKESHYEEKQGKKIY
jgi:hypothetical protein